MRISNKKMALARVLRLFKIAFDVLSFLSGQDSLPQALPVPYGENSNSMGSPFQRWLLSQAPSTAFRLVVGKRNQAFHNGR